jgi:hypothetical protein
VKCYNGLHTTTEFLAPLPGTDNPGDDIKKYQQAFLATLPGMALVKRFTNT